MKELFRWLAVVAFVGALLVVSIITFNRKRTPIGYQPPPMGDRSR